jgi:hypothetical protein
MAEAPASSRSGTRRVGRTRGPELLRRKLKAPEAEDDSVPSQITPELQKNIDKRIGKEVAKRKAPLRRS